MGQAVELKVKVSNEEQKYSKKFLCYEPILFVEEDERLAQIVEETVKEFKGPVDDVEVFARMKWGKS